MSTTPDNPSVAGCPCCNPVAYLEQAKEMAETTPAGWAGEWPVTGEEHWLRAVALVRRVNPDALLAALEEVGPVAALAPSDGPPGYCVRRHNEQ